MGVSFKVSKKGTRFRPKPKPESPSVQEDNDKVDASPQLPKNQPPTTRKRSVDVTEDDEDLAGILDAEVSFILNIFPDGYSIENPSEGYVGHQNSVQNDPKFLRPYDRTSESLFAAIECGRLPTDFLDDIHCKYSNGAVVCEVRDYRKTPCTVASPSVTKVSLKMSLNNIVNDITQISDDNWTYGDLLEAESQILKALQQKLCLDPTPNLNRLCKELTSLKLNLNIPSIRRKKLRASHMNGVIQSPMVGVQYNNGGMQRLELHQGQVAVNWRSNLGSPSVEEGIDKSMLDRFSRIGMWSERLQLNRKKNKIDEYKKTTTFPTQHVTHFLLNDHNNGNVKDEKCKMPLSKSLVGGSMNVWKTRVLKFVRFGRVKQGNGVSLVPKLRTRLILSEKQSDGTVAMHYGELDNFDYLVEEDGLPILSNTHSADLFAAEFCSQMMREGYRVEGDFLQPKLITKVQSSGGQANNGHGFLVKGEIRSTNEVAKPSNGGTRNMPSAMMDMDPNGNFSSQNGLLPSSQPSFYHQEQQLYNLNAVEQNLNIQQLGDYKDLPQQLEILQQQEAQIQRKMIMGRNNMVWVEGMGQLTLAQYAAIMADKMVQQSETNVTSGHGGQSGNIGGFQGGFNRQIHPSSSSGVSMMGYDMNPYMNIQQQMHHQQQEESRSQSQTLRSPPQQVGVTPMPHQQPIPMSP